MKKIGIPARANGLVNSMTRPAASRPADITDRMRKSFCETWTVEACAVGREAMSGRKWVVEREVWQTMEASMGVMDMFRKGFSGVVSRVRFEVDVEREVGWGRRIRRMGWRRVG